MNVICRHCLKTNRIRKELRGKWTRCQFCNAEMEEPASSASKTQRKEPVAVAEKPKLQTVAVAAPTASGSKSGSGFVGKLVFALIVIGLYLSYQHWAEQRRIERERQLASDRQVMEFLGFGAKAALQGLFSSPSPPQRPQDIGPYNPALRSPPPPRVERETTTLYDNDNNPVGKAYTTRVVPAQ